MPGTLSRSPGTLSACSWLALSCSTRSGTFSACCWALAKSLSRSGTRSALGFRALTWATEIERLKAEYAAERAALKASGEATQRDYQQLKQQHEAALGKLATAQTEAGKVPELVEQVKALKPEADKVPGLLADLATAQERYTTLRTTALAIQEKRNDLAKKVDTLPQENQRLHEAN